MTVGIYQQRMDYGPRAMQITVTNDSAEAITVTRASFVSGRFTGAATWTRATEIPAGLTRNLRVLLGDALCNGDNDARVELEFTTADGRTGTAAITPTDQFSTIAKVTAEDCLAEGFAAIAEVSLAQSIRTETHGDRLIGLIDVTATPTGATGSAAVSAIDRTILLRPEEDNAMSWPLDWTLDAASGTLTTTLAFEPSNCNPHIVAEDKRGTYFPLEVTLDDGTSGTVFFGVTDAVRGEIYGYIGAYCGW